MEEAIEKIQSSPRQDKKIRVRQEVQSRNRFRKQMSFLEFVARRDKLGYAKKTRAAKAVSEEIAGSFDNQTISDAIYALFSQDADGREKQVVAIDLAAKIVAMSQTGDVILLAASLR